MILMPAHACLCLDAVGFAADLRLSGRAFTCDCLSPYTSESNCQAEEGEYFVITNPTVTMQHNSRNARVQGDDGTVTAAQNVLNLFRSGSNHSVAGLRFEHVDLAASGTNPSDFFHVKSAKIHFTVMSTGTWSSEPVTYAIRVEVPDSLGGSVPFASSASAVLGSPILHRTRGAACAPGCDDSASPNYPCDSGCVPQVLWTASTNIPAQSTLDSVDVAPLLNHLTSSGKFRQGDAVTFTITRTQGQGQRKVKSSPITMTSSSVDRSRPNRLPPAAAFRCKMNDARWPTADAHGKPSRCFAGDSDWGNATNLLTPFPDGNGDLMANDTWWCVVECCGGYKASASHNKPVNGKLGAYQCKQGQWTQPGTESDWEPNFSCDTPKSHGDYCGTDAGHCLNNGTCRDPPVPTEPCAAADPVPTCDCAPGYSDPTCSTDVNECESNPCHNGATCTDGPDSYNCTCALGFSGSNCETDVDECHDDDTPEMNPCKHGGCQDSADSASIHPGHFQCTCDAGWALSVAPGYSDPICEKRGSSACDSNGCQNGATCVNHGNATTSSYTCTCKTSGQAECSTHCAAAGCNCLDSSTPVFAGDNCTVDVNECATEGDTACKHGATCVDSTDPGEQVPLGAYKCKCTGGYSGLKCENTVDVCASNPCQNGFNCTAAAKGDFACGCNVGPGAERSGYKGKHCDTPSPCKTTGQGGHFGTCQHDGTCSDTDEPPHFQCDCSNNPRWGGADCSIDQTPCVGYTGCTGDTPTCVADRGHPKCRGPCTGRGARVTHPCGPPSNGTCNVVGNPLDYNSFNCTCLNGWSGIHCGTAPGQVRACDMRANKCNTKDAQGTCTETASGTTCDCSPGFAFDATHRCTACEDGFDASGQGGACAGCPQGKVNTKNETAPTMCHQCPAGKQPDEFPHGKNCVACPPGKATVPSAPGTCQTCPGGKQPSPARQGHLAGETCESCPSGTAGNDGTCARCVAGKSVNNHRTCQNCQTGKAGVRPDGTSDPGHCYNCVNGTDPDGNLVGTVPHLNRPTDGAPATCTPCGDPKKPFAGWGQATCISCKSGCKTLLVNATSEPKWQGFCSICGPGGSAEAPCASKPSLERPCHA